MVVWLLAYAALAALALPLAATLFPRFPDRGAGFALPIAMAVLALVGFWVGRLSFGYVTLFAGLAVLAAGSAVALYRGVEIDRRGYAEAMAVFAVAFGLLVAVRALDPSVYPGGGEKFLDFGLLQSLWRADTVPPEDMWFAGEPVAYYYGGHMIAALLGRLTLTAPRYGYNLALAGFYGAFVTAAYTLASAVAHHRGRSRYLAGGVAAFLVGIASNLVTPLRFLAWAVPGGDGLVGALGVERISLAGGPTNFGYWHSRVVIPGTINEFPFFAFLNGDLHGHMMSPPFLLLAAAACYAYWATPARELTRRRAIVFGVVPAVAALVTFVNAWSFPAVAGVAWVALLFAPADPRDLLPMTGIRHPEPAGAGARADGGDGGGPDPGAGEGGNPDPAAGDGEEPNPGATNGGEPDPGAGDGEELSPGTGDSKPGVASRVVAPGPRRFRPGSEAVRTLTALGIAVVVGLAGLAVASPFFLRVSTGRGVALFPERSGLWALLIVHGVFLALTVRHLAPRADPGPPRRLRLLAVLGLLGGFAWLFDFFALVPFALALAAGWLLLRTGADVGYETALAVAALGLALVVEFAFVTGPTDTTRYNTVFKAYAQVWALWATAGGILLAEYASVRGVAVGLGTLLSGVGAVVVGALAGLSWPVTALLGVSFAVLGWVVVLDRARLPGTVPTLRAHRGGVLAAVLLVTLSMYTGLAVAERVDDSPDGMTLDSLAFVDRDHTAEAEAIRWVVDREGQPTTVTAPTAAMYRWDPDYVIDNAPRGQEIVGGSAPASLTGVPTVAGWYHQIGYRGHEAFLSRVDDVHAIYNSTPDQQIRLLEKYDVEYVYVGPAERSRYANHSLPDRLAGVSVAHCSGEVVIYRVDRDALAVRSGGVDDPAPSGDRSRGADEFECPGDR